MRKALIATFLVAGCTVASGQKFNAGIGFFGQNATSPGILTQFELQRSHSDVFSLPFGIDLGYCRTSDYHSVFLNVNKGFRHTFHSGFFTGQFVGMGVISNHYTVDGIYYKDGHGSIIRYNKGPNIGVMPLVGLEAGYDLDRSPESRRLIWLKPKLFWNLGIRGLHRPFWAIQLGYSWSF